MQTLKNAIFGRGAANDVSNAQAILMILAGMVLVSLPTALCWALGTLYKAVN